MVGVIPGCMMQVALCSTQQHDLPRIPSATGMPDRLGRNRLVVRADPVGERPQPDLLGHADRSQHGNHGIVYPARGDDGVPDACARRPRPDIHPDVASARHCRCNSWSCPRCYQKAVGGCRWRRDHRRCHFDDPLSRHVRIPAQPTGDVARAEVDACYVSRRRPLVGPPERPAA
jgi:hypothetical protein